MKGVTGLSWTNDLTNLEFAQSCWISVTRSVTLQVTGSGWIT
jgi:hypothetical protein